MAGGFTGYSPEEVEALGTSIKRTIGDVEKEIEEVLKSEVVTPISEVWFSKDAVEYFGQFKEVCHSAGAQITTAYNEFLKSVQNTANEGWAASTKNETVNLGEVSEIDINVNISAIKDNEGGKSGAYEQRAASATAKIPQAQDTIKSRLTQISSKIEADTAFLGHGQSSSVETCFVKIMGELSKIFAFLEDVKERIDATVKAYGDLATNVRDSYSVS